jgi:flagellin
MPAVLNTNVASLWASKNLLGAQEKMANSVERLSSGLRINRARDDAAGLGIAAALTSQINGANQGIRNLNDAISMVQTAEGAITAAQDIAQRILTLATQGATGTMGTTETDAISAEMTELLASIDSIAGRTHFSSNDLLDEAAAGVDKFVIQVSDTDTDTITLDSAAFLDIGTSGSASDLDTSVAGTDFNVMQADAKAYIEALIEQRGLLGAYQNQLEYTVSNVTDLAGNLSAARSRVIDTDYAAETANLTKGQILQQAATAMLAQANQMPNVILTLLK